MFGTPLHCAILMSTLKIVSKFLEIGCENNFTKITQLDNMILDENDNDKILIREGNYSSYCYEKINIAKIFSSKIKFVRTNDETDPLSVESLMTVIHLSNIRRQRLRGAN